MNRSVMACCLGMWLASIGCVAREAQSASTAGLMAQDDGVALHRRAKRLAAQGDLVRAEQYALLAVARGLPMPSALPLLLEVCLRASRISAALHHAEPVLRGTPDDHRLRYLVASLYAALNRREDAAHELTLLLRSQPDHREAQALLAKLQEAP